MTITRPRRHAAAVAACAAISAAAATPVGSQKPVFQSTTSIVSVSVSVKRDASVIANLKASDFALTDNGVPQTVDAVSIESVPIDVTLFLDTSGSTAGRLDDMKRDVKAIVLMLRPGDRFRLLTIGDSVDTAVPWVPAGTSVDADIQPVGGISLIHDALMFGLLHKVPPDRRHLVVGLTDRQDCGSVVPASLLLELAARSEAVMHLVDYSGGGGDARYRVRACTPRARPDGEALITSAAERTGGELHKPSRFFRELSIARVFKTIFDDFRQSYVLRYSPAGVAARGWHAIVVTLPGRTNVTIRARQGYYAD